MSQEPSDTSPPAWWRRPLTRAVGLLALLAYLPALTAAPGRMPSDSKLYLYLDPGRFVGDAASTFDPRQFAGWVPHQHVAYLWPSTPWFWAFETLGVPDWIAHRLWIGTLIIAAGLGVRWVARLLGLGTTAALVAGIVYQLSPYVLPYVSRTSVLLLPWAGLGWIVAFTIRAGRRGGWADPAAVALVVLTVGGVNATALAMIVPGPVLWLVHAGRSIGWRPAVATAWRIGLLSTLVSLWWVAMLLVQARYGVDVLPYSESLADVSLTATAPETWRSLGYWLFYVRDPYAATTTESLRYLTSSASIAISYAVPLLAVAGLAFVAWAHRRFAALLIGTGLVLAVGVHPVDDRSPLMRLVAGDDDGGLALALRSSTRALPLTVLGLALALATIVEAMRSVELPVARVTAHQLAAGGVAVLAIANLPALWTGGFVDPALERDATPPPAWRGAAAALDTADGGGRVLQVPGAEFGAFRWGYTVDQPLPGLTERPLVTRDLLPLGSPAAMDLLFAVDDRIQDGVLEPDAVAPAARLLGADTIWLANDLAFDRFRTARPEVVRDVVTDAPGLGEPVAFGDPIPNRPDVEMRDEHAIGDPRVGTPLPPVELVPLEQADGVVRARAAEVLVAGSGDGLLDAATVGLVDPATVAVRYTADLDDPAATLDGALGLVVTDSNRDRARHWRSSQDVTGFTEPGGPDAGVLRSVTSDARLEVFDTTDASTQTIAEQRGPATARATAYGEPFAYLPEHRPVMAIDGDPTTAWTVGEHGDPVGETLRLDFAEPVDRVVLHQLDAPGDRRITSITYDGSGGAGRVSLDERSWDGTGQELVLGEPVRTLELTVDEVGGGTPFTGSAVAGVGFAEIEHGLGPTLEVVRPPVRALDAVGPGTPLGIVLTRLRVDPMDRWRDDPEPTLVRGVELPDDRVMSVHPTVRVDRRATDAELAAWLGWPVAASTRLAGAPRHAGVAAFDGDSDTAWITAFGEADGASLVLDAAEPVTVVALRQPAEGFSTITELLLRSGREERRVELEPDAVGGSSADVDPPLPAGPLEIVVSGVEARTTIDRRFGDPVELPAAVNELVFNGRPSAAALTELRVAGDRCVPIATVDGTTLTATLAIRDDGWLDGEAIDAVPCEPLIELPAGHHLLVGAAGSVPVTLDRLVLDDGVAAAVAAGPEAPRTTVVRSGRFDRRIEVDGCSDGCWLILGEGLNEAWTAEVGGVDLGSPTLVDGGFNGWWLDGAPGPVVVDVRWTAQRTLDVALLCSALAVLACIALIVIERRRRAGVESAPPARPAWTAGPRPTVRRAVVTTVAWATLAGLIVGPVWAAWGAVGGAVVLLTRRGRLAELTALACLAVVAAAVLVRERRSAPVPGGGWPSAFESFHALGMFAVVCVLVAAVAADDATDDATDDAMDDAVAADGGDDRGP